MKDPGPDHDEFVAEAKAFAAREEERSRRFTAPAKPPVEPFETVVTDPNHPDYAEPF